MKVVEEQDNRLVFEVTGESHTICNILRKRLMSQDEVTAAAYDITHPLVGQPEFEVNSPNPRESIKTASETIKQEATEFKDAVTKAFK
ncbi:MAG: DNA-directed RNA polymerase subunit L [Methanosphaera sp. rholeuAM130]|nr:MAG: DNA-directed RNA polymerase subunit L [Methanosphaera sp. rholeuAM130]